MEIWMDDYRGIRGDKSNGKEKRRGSMKGKMVLRFGVERWNRGGDERKRAEERTLVSNHLPRRKSAVKAIHQRDKANIDGVNCLFSSSPNSSKWNVQSKRCGLAKTFHLPLHINILRLTIDSQTPRDKLNPYSINLSQKNDNYLKNFATKNNQIFSCQTLMSIIPTQTNKASNWHRTTAENKTSA